MYRIITVHRPFFATHHDEHDKIDPVPEGMGILGKAPLLQQFSKLNLNLTEIHELLAMRKLT